MIGLDAGYAALVAGGLSFGWLLFVWCSGRRDHGINSTDGNTGVVNSSMDTDLRPPSPQLSPIPLAPQFNEAIMERTIIRTRRVWLELRNPSATSVGASSGVYSGATEE